MSSSRKPALLATVVALGLIAAVYYEQAARRRSSTTRSGDTDTAAAAAAAAADKQRSAMEVDEPPLSLAPAPAGSKALVVCRRGSEEASAAQQWASRSRSDGATVSVCPPGHLESHARANAGAYDTIVVEEAGEGAVLGQVVKLLKAGGNVNVAASSQGGEAAAAAALKRALTFAGFLNVTANPEDPRVLSGERAAWETGASAPVRLSFGASKNGVRNGTNGNGPAAAATATAAAAANKTWKLALDDDEGGAGGAEDDDLIDEDALLESSAPVKRASETAGDGCATKRRACKDCSCGRAEMEMSGGVSNTNGGAAGPLPVVSVGDVDDALTSACGNCSKGDAFRCGGCPFLGKPAFEKGQEKTIMLLDLDSQQDD